jgi:hypothetical protein
MAPLGWGILAIQGLFFSSRQDGGGSTASPIRRCGNEQNPRRSSTACDGNWREQRPQAAPGVWHLRTYFLGISDRTSLSHVRCEEVDITYCLDCLLCSEQGRGKWLFCQRWKEIGINDTRMDSGTGRGAHRIVERRGLRQRNWSPTQRYEKCGHRQSLPPPTAQTPTVVSDPSGRPECHPTGATRSGHVQLAPGCAREGWFSLLWRGGCSGETLLPYALQSSLCTSSQRSKGYCGRLTFAAGANPDSRDIAYPENRRSTYRRWERGVLLLFVVSWFAVHVPARKRPSCSRPHFRCWSVLNVFGGKTA